VAGGEYRTLESVHCPSIPAPLLKNYLLRREFTSIRSTALELDDVNVLVGANGAGKSNLIRAIGVLGRIVDGELGLYVGLSGGASALLNADPAAPRRIRLQVESGAGGYSAERVPAAGDTGEALLVRNTGVLTSLGREWSGSLLVSALPTIHGPSSASYT